MTVVFLSNSVDTPWTSKLASALQRRGVQSDLWVVDEEQRRRDAALPGFRRVINIASLPSALPDLEALRSIEEANGKPLLHQAALSDRMMTGRNLGIPSLRPQRRWTYHALVRLADALTRNARAYFAEARPDLIVTEVADFASQWLCAVGRLDGVRVVGPFMESYLPRRIRFLDYGSAHWPEVVQLVASDKPLSASAVSHAHETFERLRQAQYALVASAIGDSRRRATLRAAWRDWRAASAYAMSESPHAMHAHLVSPATRAERYVRTRMGRRLYGSLAQHELPGRQPFVVYFLHAQPEVTVEHQAFRYLDQLATIRNIAAVAPAHMPLIVKEHGFVCGNRDAAFYEELASMPTVSLLHHSVPTARVVREASAVVTLTGTVALEAICNRTPAIVLGDTYYRDLPGAFGVDSYEDIGHLIERHPQLARATDEDCIRLLAARYDATSPGMWPGCSFDDVWDESTGAEITATSLVGLISRLADTAVHPRSDQQSIDRW